MRNEKEPYCTSGCLLIYKKIHFKLLVLFAYFCPSMKRVSTKKKSGKVQEMSEHLSQKKKKLTSYRKHLN